jgi:hypothetical protein
MPGIWKMNSAESAALRSRSVPPSRATSFSQIGRALRSAWLDCALVGLITTATTSEPGATTAE